LSVSVIRITYHNCNKYYYYYTAKKADRRDFDIRSSDLYFYILSNLGPEFISSIQGEDASTPNQAWNKLSEMFEGSNHITISLALRNLTTFSSVGISTSKFLANINLLSESLKSVIPKDMTTRINDKDNLGAI
jgi:hypothetical protein